MSGALAMPFRFGRTPTRDLTHVAITLGRQRWRGRWLLVPMLVALALAFGAGVGYLLHERLAPVVVALPVAPSPELPQLRRQLAEAQMGLQLSDARSHELERQIDALNQKLSEAQEQLTFVRKAREGRH
jgi:septal ring factor EnvC (AmiA/AmiB activator)